MQKGLIHIIFLIVPFMGTCQNLVPNNSFELNHVKYFLDTSYCLCGEMCNPWNCPGLDTFNYVKPWYSPNSHVPANLRKCSFSPLYRVPYNQFGKQWPRTGDCYAQICVKFLYPEIWADYREYLQVKLISPLKRDCEYYIEFFAAKNDTIAFAVDRIGLYVSDTMVYSLCGIDEVLPFTPQIDNPEYNIIYDADGWVKISGTYTAHGGEQYITIGNFYDDDHTHHVLVNDSTTYEHRGQCGFYIDDVSVIPLCPPEPEPIKDPLVYIPNIFSPNGDGQNDILYIRGQGIDAVHIMIYNRWGEKVFESSDIGKGWDGTFKGKKCPAGVYFYVGDITFKNGEKLVRKGDVSLVR